MPQLKQSAKRLRQSKKLARANKRVKDNIDYLARNFKKAVTAKDKSQAQDFAKKLIKLIDKAAKRNIYHLNKAARKKSRMMKTLNSNFKDK